MIDRVLYGVDFGEYQPLALPCLARLREAGCRELVLVHVMNERRSLREVPDLLRDDVADCLEKAVQQRMDEWARICSQDGMTVRPLVAEGRMQWIKLCDIAREEEASLVVLGPRARKDPGSTTYFAMHAGVASLLILKMADPSLQEPYGDSCKGLFARVLLPTDWSECALRAEQQIIELRNAGTEEVILAHVTELGLTEIVRKEYEAHSQRRLAHSRRTLEEVGLQVRSLLLEGDPSGAIVDAAERENASLIVMGSTGKSVTEEQRLGSISERVALSSGRSVLLVH